MTVTVRAATPSEYTAVEAVLNAAMLAFAPDIVRRASTLVAVDDGRILGALVLDGNRIEAVAVRPGRRGQGIGDALVAEAGRRRPELVAEFDPDVRPFYAALGFEIECDGGRCLGRFRSHNRFDECSTLG